MDVVFGIGLCAKTKDGKEEFRILLLRTLQLSAGRHLWRPRYYPLHGSAQHPGLEWQDDVGSDQGPDIKILVLRSLIENFGGEATSEGLSERSSGRIERLPTHKGSVRPSSIEVRTALAQLSSSGAITLEDLDETEVIARITLAGAILAYSKRNFSTP